MRIISKHKDYYDYLVGHYGRDEHIVYDRRNPPRDFWVRPEEHDQFQHFSLAICGELLNLVSHQGDIIFRREDLPKSMGGWSEHHARNHLKESGKPTDQNLRHRSPVLLVGRGKEKIIPILSEFGIPSIIDPHEIYQRIYAFLGWLKDNPEAPQIKDDKCKIRAHGFDTRTSFRPKIKL